jgi:hypothetical protein
VLEKIGEDAIHRHITGRTRKVTLIGNTTSRCGRGGEHGLHRVDHLNVSP